MAKLIVEKQLRRLADFFKAKEIDLSFTDALKQYVLDKGLTKEYGAREIIRVIDNELKPLFIDDLLANNLKATDSCTLDYKDDKLVIDINHGTGTVTGVKPKTKSKSKSTKPTKKPTEPKAKSRSKKTNEE
jgi:ATP-dependent Clp protease ATP-binding subunit ClpA